MNQGNRGDGRLQIRLLWVIACISLAHTAMADTLHAIADAAYQHHGSSWVFPEKIGEFARVGAPQDVDGTIDVVAYYAAIIDGRRIVAIVDVYPPDSAAAGAKLADAKAALESAAVRERSEGTLEVGNPPLTARKLHYLIGDERADSQQYLYFIDAGAWIVKIRSEIPTADLAADAVLDNFVRGQRWDSLGLTTPGR